MTCRARMSTAAGKPRESAADTDAEPHRHRNDKHTHDTTNEAVVVKAAATAVHEANASGASATRAVGACSLGDSRDGEAVHQQHQEDQEGGPCCGHGRPTELAAQASLQEALAARAREYEKQWRDARSGRRRLTLVQMNQVGRRMAFTTVNHPLGTGTKSTGG